MRRQTVKPNVCSVVKRSSVAKHPDWSKFDEPEIVVREIARFGAEQKRLSHRDNFGEWVSRVQQVVRLAQWGLVLP
jgi:hypothetical protein